MYFHLFKKKNYYNLIKNYFQKYFPNKSIMFYEIKIRWELKMFITYFYVFKIKFSCSALFLIIFKFIQFYLNNP